MRSFNRDVQIDENLEVFRTYPPNGRQKHTFGRYELEAEVVWVDLTEFRNSKGFDSIPTYTIDSGVLVFASYKSKRWLSENAGVC